MSDRCYDLEDLERIAQKMRSRKRQKRKDRKFSRLKGGCDCGKVLALLQGLNIPPVNGADYAAWLNRQRYLKVIRDRYYPDYLEDWEGRLQLTPGSLAGLGSTSSAGSAEEIALGANLVMLGTTLHAVQAPGTVNAVMVSNSGVSVAADTLALETFFPDWLIFTVRNLGAANSLDCQVEWENSFGDSGTFVTTILPLANFSFNHLVTTGTMGPPPFFSTGATSFKVKVRDTVAGFGTAWALESSRLVYV